MRASPSVESAGGIASPALCIGECRSLVQLRSHSHQQRRAAAQFELLCGPHAGCPSRRDQPKLRDTADRLGDWRNGTIARQCGRGETGNRAGFRCPCSRELEGSSPSARTDALAVFAQVDSGFHVRCDAPWARGGHILGTLSGSSPSACRAWRSSSSTPVLDVRPVATVPRSCTSALVTQVLTALPSVWSSQRSPVSAP
jgi:hypothetical protein